MLRMNPNVPLYLDYSATTPLDPRVLRAMLPFFHEEFGNPSSIHRYGQRAEAAVESSREVCSALLNCHPSEIVFTSCGSESDNLALRGVAFAARHLRHANHILISPVEHHAVSHTAEQLHSIFGFEVELLPVDQYGMVDPQVVASRIRSDTALVSIIYANNEIGTIQPIEEIARITREKNIVFHVDAVDSVGVVPVDVQKLGVDLLSFASNSFYGPAGVGGVYVRRGTHLWPLLDGGVQENNRRAGTENLIGIIGMGVAAELAVRDMTSRITAMKQLKDLLLRELPNTISEYIVNGHPELSLPHLASVSIKYIEGESLVLMLDDDNIAVSTRSACAAGALQASHVLLSIGRDFADAQGTLVITFGLDNSEEDVSRFLKALKEAVKTLREISPLYAKTAKG